MTDVIEFLKKTKVYNEEILNMPLREIEQRIKAVSIEIDKAIGYIEHFNSPKENNKVLEFKKPKPDPVDMRTLAKSLGIKWSKGKNQSEYFGLQDEDTIKYFHKFKEPGLYQEICEGCSPAIADFDVNYKIEDILSKKLSIVKQPQKESKDE